MAGHPKIQANYQTVNFCLVANSYSYQNNTYRTFCWFCVTKGMVFILLLVLFTDVDDSRGSEAISAVCARARARVCVCVCVCVYLSLWSINQIKKELSQSLQT